MPQIQQRRDTSHKHCYHPLIPFGGTIIKAITNAKVLSNHIHAIKFSWITKCYYPCTIQKLQHCYYSCTSMTTKNISNMNKYWTIKFPTRVNTTKEKSNIKLYMSTMC